MINIYVGFDMPDNMEFCDNKCKNLIFIDKEKRYILCEIHGLVDYSNGSCTNYIEDEE